MHLPVMNPAQWGDEFVADFSAKRARLRKTQMMGVGGFSSAHQTGLPGNEPEMLFVAIATRLGKCEAALVDRFGLRSAGSARTLLFSVSLKIIKRWWLF
jgi:hypothetical protein